MEAGVDAQASYKFAVKAKALEGQQISFSEDGTGASTCNVHRQRQHITRLNPVHGGRLTLANVRGR